jgi:hypothetical protein
MFERDPNQASTPFGCTAYILRSWGVISEGVVSEVTVSNGLPKLRFVDGGGTRLARYADEASRVFVRDDALIDKAVFDILAPRKLETVPTSLADIRWEWD